MRNFFIQIAPAIIFVIFVGISVAPIYFVRYKNNKSNKKTPLTQDLLRAPGHSLAVKINGMTMDIFSNLLLVAVVPILLYCSYLSILLTGKSPSLFVISFLILTGLLFTFYQVRKIYKAFNLKTQFALGLDAEMAVGQELNYLMHEGYWVFHDFPAKDFNIDHVVIGKNGVFAVETKGRAKIDKLGKNEVVYDGKVLKFPSWDETKPLEQAKSESAWLQNWLTREMGEKVEVQPVLALPGWFVSKTGKGSVSVINGKNSISYFQNNGLGNLSEKLMNQIKNKVEDRCRTVEPQAYGKKKQGWEQ